jgi:hypothetical protein
VRRATFGTTEMLNARALLLQADIFDPMGRSGRTATNQHGRRLAGVAFFRREHPWPSVHIDYTHFNIVCLAAADREKPHE